MSRSADRVLAPLPDEVSDEAAVFLADNLPTGYDAVVRGGGERDGDTVCVVGLGAGRADGRACARSTPARGVLRGRQRARRGVATAERLGAETVAPERGRRGGRSPQRRAGSARTSSIEAAGSPGALDAALRLARGRGIVSVVGAHFEPDYPLDNALMFERELTLRFSIGDAAGAPRHAARADRRGAPRPGASSRTGCRSPTPPRPTACSTHARR